MVRERNQEKLAALGEYVQIVSTGDLKNPHFVFEYHGRTREHLQEPLPVW